MDWRHKFYAGHGPYKSDDRWLTRNTETAIRCLWKKWEIIKRYTRFNIGVVYTPQT
jgi:hypothetical protein